MNDIPSGVGPKAAERPKENTLSYIRLALKVIGSHSENLTESIPWKIPWSVINVATYFLRKLEKVRGMLN